MQKNNSKRNSSGSQATTPIWGTPLSRAEIMRRLRENDEIYNEFLSLSAELQEELVAFAMGVKGMKMTYDVFFKHIFDTSVYPERLESFLSECLKEKVKILAVLPTESSRLTEESSLLVADILVRLEDGSLVNVEIQRVGYLFPGARCACYSSDMLMRQYSQVRAKLRREEKPFSYKAVKKVYTIVLMHRSTAEFHEMPDVYMHYAKQTFNTGLNFDLLQEYLLIPLDIFLKSSHNKINRLEAWLYFIGSDDLGDVEKVVTAYPEFQELYRDVFRFRYQMGELVSMYSEILAEFDANTVQLMIEEQQKQLEENQQKLEEQQKELEEQQKELEEQQKELEEQCKKNQELEEENKRLKALLSEK